MDNNLKYIVIKHAPLEIATQKRWAKTSSRLSSDSVHSAMFFTLVTSSAWKNKRNAATGGIGFLISPRAIQSCTSIKSHNERIMEIYLLGNPSTTVICSYSHHNEYPEEIVTAFYQELSSMINIIPAHNLLMIGGDFNALFTLAKETNRNRRHMKDFIDQHTLVVTNTKFQNRTNRLWTHRRPNGKLVQIDFYHGEKEMDQHRQEFSRIYRSFEGINSDYRIVSCKCQISYRKCKTIKKDPIKRIDWKRVLTFLPSNIQ